jgi:hypothetical protein
LPCFEILPSRSLPPVECCLGNVLADNGVAPQPPADAGPQSGPHGPADANHPARACEPEIDVPTVLPIDLRIRMARRPAAAR